MFNALHSKLNMRGVFIIVLCCAMHCCTTTAQQHICGKMLDQMFSVVCQYGMPSKVHKKSVDALSAGNESLEFAMSPEGFPLLDRLDVRNSMLRLRRSYFREIGAYDECCIKGCFLSEMVEYCLQKPN